MTIQCFTSFNKLYINIQNVRVNKIPKRNHFFPKSDCLYLDRCEEAFSFKSPSLLRFPRQQHLMKLPMLVAICLYLPHVTIHGLRFLQQRSTLMHPSHLRALSSEVISLPAARKNIALSSRLSETLPWPHVLLQLRPRFPIIVFSVAAVNALPSRDHQ